MRQVTQRCIWSEVLALSVIGTAKNLRPRYNIAPTTTIDIVCLSEAGRELNCADVGSGWPRPI